ncbi:MAG: hypothetical protein ACTSWY_08070 [Promethearchaeota archaeon]
MITCLLRPILRDQGIIKFSSKLMSLKAGQTYIAVSDQSPKKYSFLVKIIEFEQNSEYNNIPVLEIDSRKLGPLGENDSVNLYPYNVPVADRIEIGVIEETHIGIPAGDWTSTLRPNLLNKSLDLGDNINCALEFKDGEKENVRLIRGILINSYTEPPVKVGAVTVCELKKLSREKFRQKKVEIERKKEKRADEYIEKIKREESPIEMRKIPKLLEKCPDCGKLLPMEYINAENKVICEFCGCEVTIKNNNNKN